MTPLGKNRAATEAEKEKRKKRVKTAPGGRNEADQATGFTKDGDQTGEEVFIPTADLLRK